MLWETLRSISKRPDIEGIFKHTSNKSAGNYTIFDIWKVLDNLKSKGKVENKPAKKGMDSFFGSIRSTMCRGWKGIWNCKFWIFERQEKGYTSWYLNGNVQDKKCLNYFTTGQSRNIYSTDGCYESIFYEWSIKSQR